MDALVEAREELEALQAREAELERQIAEAEAVLAVSAEPGEGQKTLHEALTIVLKENSNEWMTARELANAVNARGLYRKRDGSEVEVNQVHARTNNYGAVFEKVGAKIRLREESPMLATMPRGITLFRDDDEGFFDWLDENPDGFFINTERKPNPNYLVLHEPQCRHFKGRKGEHWTRDYVKVCSLDRKELEKWAVVTVGGEGVTLCGSCFG